MEEGDFIEYSRIIITKFSSRLNLKNPRNIMRFLNAYYVIYNICPDDFDLLNEYKNILIEKINNYNVVDFNKISFELFQSLLMILQKSELFFDDSLKSVVLKKLNKIGQSYKAQSFQGSKFLFLEDILFIKDLNHTKISNQISIELIYYALYYRKLLFGRKNLLENNVTQLLKENYYIPQQKEFAFFPTYQTPIYSIHSSRKDSLEKDYWASRILQLLRISTLNEDWNDLLYEMKERAKYLLESYQETEELDINLSTYHSIMTLKYLQECNFSHFQKIIMDYDNIELSSNILLEIIDVLHLSWNEVEWDNYQIDETRQKNIKQFLDFFKERKFFPLEILDWLESFFITNKKVQKFKTNDIKSFTALLNNNEYYENIFYYAFLCAEENIFTLPIEYYIESESAANTDKKILEIMLQLIFCKLFLEIFPIFREFLHGIFYSKEKMTVLNDNKGNTYLVEENDIIEFLINYQEKSREKIEFENKNELISFLSTLKRELKKTDLPKFENLQSNYVVYPNTLVKIDAKYGNVKGLRLTIDIRDLELKLQIQNIKDYLNTFFNKICNIAQQKYQIREFLEDSNGNENMIEFLKGLYNEDYHHIIKIDIKSCTDQLLFAPMKYVLFNILPDNFAQLIYDVATKYTIEFEDRRITPIRGIAQGNPLSSELYTFIILTLIMASLEQAKNIEKKPVFLCFGDDILILSKEIQSLNIIFPIMVNNFRVMGWEFDSEKTLLITPTKVIPPDIRYLKCDDTFSSVGFQIKTFDSLQINLIPERIIRIQYQFYNNLARLIQDLFDQEKGSLERFINAATQFQRQTSDFPFNNSFSIVEFLNLKYKEIGNYLGLKTDNNALTDIDLICKKIVELIGSLKIIPPPTLFEPDIIIYTDGAATPNPGNAGIGIYIPTLNIQEKYFLGFKTNNEAEYSALLCALRLLDKKMLLNKKIQIYSDSKIMIWHLNGICYVRNNKMKELRNYIKRYEKKINRNQGQIRYTHIYGKTNDEADRLSREAIEDYYQNKAQRFSIDIEELPQED